jgi:hypothetical protein
MSIRVRKGTRAAQAAIITEINRMRDALVASNFHASVTRGPTVESDDSVSAAALTIASANASTLLTSLTLVNEIKAVLNTHYADMGAHKSVQTAAITTVDATDLTTGQTLANAIKASYNTGGHINTANVHHTDDATNTIAAANATDQSSLNTLLNELKTDINAHMAGALAGWHIQLVDG